MWEGDSDCRALGSEGFEGHGKHLEGGCGCKDAGVDRMALEGIIRRDEIPVLYFDEEEGRLGVRSSKSELGLEYTALSHV